MPLTTDMTGMVKGEAGAGATAAGAVLFEKMPSAGPGNILTVGPPAVGGAVGYPATTDTYSGFAGTATAVSGATSIRGIPSGPGGGVINMVNIAETTPVSATITGVATAIATASARTDPFVLAPLDAPTDVVLHVDLVNYLDNPGGTVNLTAFASGQASSNASFEYQATTNIPGLSQLFDLRLSADSSSNSVDVNFTSPLIGQPFGSGDFTSNGLGTFTLDGSKTTFDVPFTIPAGIISTDQMLGPIGLLLNVNQDAAAQAVGVPEPSTWALALAGLTGLVAIWRGRWRQKVAAR